MASRTVVQFRCTDEFKAELERLAAKENRTVSNYITNLVTREIEKERESKNMKVELNLMNEVDKKYHEFLETTPGMKFYLDNGKYFVKTDWHYDELGDLDDVIYYLDCQLEPQD